MLTYKHSCMRCRARPGAGYRVLRPPKSGMEPCNAAQLVWLPTTHFGRRCRPPLLSRIRAWDRREPAGRGRSTGGAGRRRDTPEPVLRSVAGPPLYILLRYSGLILYDAHVRHIVEASPKSPPDGRLK